eukprot:2626159-Rhodomonas_salina.5
MLLLLRVCRAERGRREEAEVRTLGRTSRAELRVFCATRIASSTPHSAGASSTRTRSSVPNTGQEASSELADSWARARAIVSRTAVGPAPQPGTAQLAAHQPHSAQAPAASRLGARLVQRADLGSGCGSREDGGADTSAALGMAFPLDDDGLLSDGELGRVEADAPEKGLRVEGAHGVGDGALSERVGGLGCQAQDQSRGQRHPRLRDAG